MSTSFNNKYDKTNILLRRDEVRRLTTLGLTETEIGQRLGISQSCVCLDLQYMECKAAERMKEHIEKTIPTVHSYCLDGLRMTLRKAWDSVIDKDGKDRELRPTELTQKLSLIAELYEKIYNLSTEGPTLTRAMEIVRLEKERLRILEERYGSHSDSEDINTQELHDIQESISKLEPDIEENEEDVPNEDSKIKVEEEEVIEEEAT